MIDAPTRDATMVVVDDDRAGYELLALPAAGEGVTLRFLSTGREALRLAETESIALWLIGVDLPDMSGFDLQQMLADGSPETTVCMVAAAYRAEDEVRAHCNGVALYACKPLSPSWLRSCLHRARARGESLYRDAAIGVPRPTHHGMGPWAQRNDPGSLLTGSRYTSGIA
jgi:DNA-binding response OmpR family regulator